MIRKTPLSKDQAYQKIKQFCAYQERCHKEVKEKLYSYGLWRRDVEELLSMLIEDGYLNEERFALAYAGGKFRMKGWGRVKIQYELKQKQVSAYCIKKALQSIPEEDYEKALSKLATKKWSLLKDEPDGHAKKRKVSDYLIQRGFEWERISSVVNELTV